VPAAVRRYLSEPVMQRKLSRHLIIAVVATARAALPNL
jgi:hypothetical protein